MSADDKKNDEKNDEKPVNTQATESAAPRPSWQNPENSMAKRLQEAELECKKLKQTGAVHFVPPLDPEQQNDPYYQSDRLRYLQMLTGERIGDTRRGNRPDCFDDPNRTPQRSALESSKPSYNSVNTPVQGVLTLLSDNGYPIKEDGTPPKISVFSKPPSKEKLLEIHQDNQGGLKIVSSLNPANHDLLALLQIFEASSAYKKLVADYKQTLDPGPPRPKLRR